MKLKMIKLMENGNIYYNINKYYIIPVINTSRKY